MWGWTLTHKRPQGQKTGLATEMNCRRQNRRFFRDKIWNPLILDTNLKATSPGEKISKIFSKQRVAEKWGYLNDPRKKAWGKQSHVPAPAPSGAGAEGSELAIDLWTGRGGPSFSQYIVIIKAPNVLKTHFWRGYSTASRIITPHRSCNRWYLFGPKKRLTPGVGRGYFVG